RFVNPILRNFAHASLGPFALLRHVGRKSGKTYEIPIWIWPVDGGFLIVLTYGPDVDWLRNLQAAGGGSLRYHQHEYVFQKPEPLDAQTALPALPALIRFGLGLRGTHEFVKLKSSRVN